MRILEANITKDAEIQKITDALTLGSIGYLQISGAATASNLLTVARLEAELEQAADADERSLYERELNKYLYATINEAEDLIEKAKQLVEAATAAEQLAKSKSQ